MHISIIFVTPIPRAYVMERENRGGGLIFTHKREASCKFSRGTHILFIILIHEDSFISHRTTQ